MCPVSRCRRGLRRDPSGSALPIIPQSVSRGARLSRLHWFAFATACQVARPPGRIGPSFPRPPGAFTSRLPAARPPFPPLDITTTATGLLCWRDFHPQEWQLASLHQNIAGSNGSRADDSVFRERLEEALATYIDTRAAATEITTTLIALGAGALTLKQATPGTLVICPALATAMAQQTAIASFPLGATLGGTGMARFRSRPPCPDCSPHRRAHKCGRDRCSGVWYHGRSGSAAPAQRFRITGWRLSGCEILSRQDQPADRKERQRASRP